jgi:hypothetical protein
MGTSAMSGQGQLDQQVVVAQKQQGREGAEALRTQ